MPRGKHSSYFVVTPDPDRLPNPQAQIPATNEAESIKAQVDLALLRLDGIAKAEDTVTLTEKDITEASPWLELTR